MNTLIIALIVLWAYVAVVLSLVAAELITRGRGEQRDTFNMILVRAAVMLFLAPLLAFAARVDWYDESEG